MPETRQTEAQETILDRSANTLRKLDWGVAAGALLLETIERSSGNADSAELKVFLLILLAGIKYARLRETNNDPDDEKLRDRLTWGLDLIGQAGIAWFMLNQPEIGKWLEQQLANKGGSETVITPQPPIAPVETAPIQEIPAEFPQAVKDVLAAVFIGSGVVAAGTVAAKVSGIRLRSPIYRVKSPKAAVAGGRHYDLHRSATLPPNPSAQSYTRRRY